MGHELLKKLVPKKAPKSILKNGRKAQLKGLLGGEEEINLSSDEEDQSLKRPLRHKFRKCVIAVMAGNRLMRMARQ